MDIALSPRNVTNVKASYHGGAFTFDIKHFSVEEQASYEMIAKKSVDEEWTLQKFLEERWNFSIVNCYLENPFSELAMPDILTILRAVNDVNNGVAEKKS